MSDNEAVTSKNFSLTALINVHPEMDVPVDIDSSWYGHDSVNASRVTISNSNKSSVVQFTPLISCDEGTYSFSTRVRALDSEYLCPSSLVKDSIDISPSKCIEYTITLFMHMIIICNFYHYRHVMTIIIYYYYNANSILCKLDNFSDTNN